MKPKGREYQESPENREQFVGPALLQITSLGKLIEDMEHLLQSQPLITVDILGYRDRPGWLHSGEGLEDSLAEVAVDGNR